MLLPSATYAERDGTFTNFRATCNALMRRLHRAARPGRPGKSTRAWRKVSGRTGRMHRRKGYCTILPWRSPRMPASVMPKLAILMFGQSRKLSAASALRSMAASLAGLALSDSDKDWQTSMQPLTFWQKLYIPEILRGMAVTTAIL